MASNQMLGGSAVGTIPTTLGSVGGGGGSGGNGAPGAPGASGPTGVTGPTGATGLQGPMGTSGGLVTYLDSVTQTLSGNMFYLMDVSMYTTSISYTIASVPANSTANLVRQFIVSPSFTPSILTAGVWDMNLWASVNMNNPAITDMTVYFTVGLVNPSGVLQSTIATSELTQITGLAVTTEYVASAYVPTTSISAGNLIRLSVYTNNNDPTKIHSFTLFWADSATPSHVHTSLATAPGPQGSSGPTGPTGPVAGSDTQIIYNKAGVAGATGVFTFNYTTGTLTTSALVVSNNAAVTGTATVSSLVVNNNASFGGTTTLSSLVVSSAVTLSSLTSGTVTNVLTYNTGTGSVGYGVVGPPTSVNVFTVSATSLTLTTASAGWYFYLSNSAFSALTLPSPAPTTAGTFWTLRNATSSYLSVTVANNANLATPLILTPSNNTTIVYTVSGTNNATVSGYIVF